jgi:hypothetical protein
MKEKQLICITKKMVVYSVQTKGSNFFFICAKAFDDDIGIIKVKEQGYELLSNNVSIKRQAEPGAHKILDFSMADDGRSIVMLNTRDENFYFDDIDPKDEFNFETEINRATEG